jgi:integrase
MAENNRAEPVARPGVTPGVVVGEEEKVMLTVKRIEKLRRTPGRYLDRNGLVLEVFSPKSASWFLRYQRAHRERWLGLGPLHTYTLAEARVRARKARGLLADGVDPIEEKRRAETRSITFEATAQAYYLAHHRGWTNDQHRKSFLNSLRDHVFPRLGQRPIGDIDEADVLSVLKPIWHEKTVTAQRVRNRMERVIDFAIAAKYRSNPNPAKWAVLQHLLPAPEKIARAQHHPAMSYAELPAFMVRLRDVNSVAARALEFAILTATRRSEVYAARWSEIDWAAATWTIPASRMKTRKPYRVPLAPHAITLLRALYPEDGNAYVFVGAQQGQCVGESAMMRALRELDPHVTVHGFRSTFSDWARTKPRATATM